MKSTLSSREISAVKCSKIQRKQTIACKSTCHVWTSTDEVANYKQGCLEAILNRGEGDGKSGDIETKTRKQAVHSMKVIYERPLR